MATPKVSITFDADLSQLKKATADAEKSVSSFEDSVLNFSKKTAAAFALAATAAAAYATKLVVDGVQSAIADEAAQLRLASALKTATGATDAQIAATEKYISKISLTTGIADDQLRPAFQKLAVATGDVTKSQDILNLAIDVSRGSGVQLESIVTQLSKAYAGQDTGLAKLGIGITAADAKTMTFKDNVQRLTDLWGGAAAANSDTLAVKLEIMKNRFNEAKESIGTALLPILTTFAEYILTNVVPSIEAFVSGLTGDDSLVSGFDNAQLAAFNFGEQTKSVIKTLIGLKDQAIVVASILAGVFTASAIIGGISSIVTAIKTLIVAYNALKSSAIVAGIASYFALNPLAGLTATAVAAGILAGANALARGSDTATDFGLPGFDPNAGYQTGANGSGGFTSGSAPMGGDGNMSAADIAAHNARIRATSGNPEGAKSLVDLATKLQGISDKIGETTFLLQTGGITSKNAQAILDPLKKQFDLLSNQTDVLVGMQNGLPAVTTNPLAGTYYGQTGRDAPIINLTVNGAIDSEGTARTIVQNLNDSYDHGTGGANNFNTTGSYSKFG